MEILLYTLLALLAFQFQILVHEGSHAIATLLFENRILSFKFFPHFHKQRFYFGRVEWSWNENTTREERKKQRKVVSYAPYPVATFLGLLFCVLFLCFGWKGFIIFSIAAFIDLGRNHLRFAEHADVTKVGLTLSLRLIIAALSGVVITGLCFLFFL